MFHLPRLNESSPSVANELVDMQNISHIQELYQNLPQLQKAAHSPFDTFQANPMEYSHPYEQPMRHVRMPAVYNRPQFHQHRHEPPLNNDRMIYKRQGYGGGWGKASQHHKGNSPALSALALLSFMFFLQMIQTSLQNNRQLLTAAALNATTVGLVAGREAPNYYGIPLRHLNLGPSDNLDRKNRDVKPRLSTPKETAKNNSQTATKQRRKQPPGKTFNYFESTRSSSINCLQLVACKLGETIYDRLEPTTSFMVRMLGATMIPRVSKKTWTGRVLRAFDRGSKKENCSSLYQNCPFLNFST